MRIHQDESLCPIQFCPWGGGATPPGFGCFEDRGALVAPVYWGSQWPLTRNWGGTPYAINDHVYQSPGHNTIITAATFRPRPLQSELLWTRSARQELRFMKRERWAWLIGMTDAGDDELRQRALSFAQPPTLEVQGAALNSPSYYAPERRALCLTVERAAKSVSLMITPAGACVHPVLELDAAPKLLRALRLDGRGLGADQYRWDGRTLWLGATFDRPTALQLEFSGNDRQNL